MSDLRMVTGFEDVWRPPVRTRWVQPASGRRGGAGAEPRTRLARLVARAPEVMVKITGRTRDGAHLRAHLDYITRHGALEAEDSAGLSLGREAVQDLAQDWAAIAERDPRRRANTPVSHSLMLSMPAGTDPIRLRDAGRAFARDAFGARFEYVLVLHTDTPRPHLHLSVRSLGMRGERLNPKKADLEAWRQLFAEALRDRGIAAEATPRRARGVTRKAERGPILRMLGRAMRDKGPLPRVRAAAYRDAAGAAFGADRERRPWEAQILRRQQRIRGLYLGQARLLQASPEQEDRALGRALEAFIRDMPAPDTQRLALARDLRAASASPARGQGRERDRQR